MDSHPTIKKIFFSFLRLGSTSFGGPAMVANIRELATRQHQWLKERDFKNGIVLCQSIPGNIALQAAAYVGLRVHGIPGALAAYLGFGLPAFIFMLLLSILYVHFNNTPLVLSVFNGLQVIIVAIILHAVFSFGQNIAKNYRSIFIALVSSAAFWLGVSPFLVIIAAGITGIFLFRKYILPAADSSVKAMSFPIKQSIIIIFFILFCFTGLYFLNYKLFDLGSLMFKIDLFAFGGGFASLPLMLHEVVISKGWLDNKTFMDGIALGQVTPGPIIMTATFVGYLVRGLSGAAVATIAVLTPSFLILITIAPFFDRLKNSVYFVKAIEGIFASFIGLLLYVCIKFAIDVPWDIIRIILGLAAVFALFRKLNIIYIVLIGAAISVFIL